VRDRCTVLAIQQQKVPDECVLGARPKQSIAIQRQGGDKQGLTLSLLALAEFAQSLDDTAAMREVPESRCG
jgi:hypothetical protein